MFNEDKRDIGEEIMYRVKWVYFAKYWLIPSALEAAALIGLVLSAGFFVSFPDIIRNMASVWNTGSLFAYLFLAVMQTEFIVKALIIVIIGSFFYCSWSGIKKIKMTRSIFLRV